MDTKLLRLAWRPAEHPEVRAWSAPDGTEVRVIPAHETMSGTTEVLYRVPGIDGTFYVRPNLPRQRDQFRWMMERLARHGRLIDREGETEGSGPCQDGRAVGCEEELRALLKAAGMHD